MSIHDLDYLINLAYEYYYLKNSNKCFDVIDIETSDAIEISNIKIIPTPDKINSYINNIFNVDINYLGKNGSNYMFNRIGALNTMIFLRQYIDSESRLDPNSEDNNNKQISFLLSDFSTKKLTKHILLPILNIDIPTKSLISFLSKYSELQNIISHPDRILSVSIFERFFHMMTLTEYLDTNGHNMTDMDLLNLIFQVVHTLAIIRQRFPNFNHNLLNTNNIVLYQIEKTSHEHKYEYFEQTFNLPSNGFIIKLANFDLSQINAPNSDDIKIFINSLMSNSNVKKLLNKYITIQKIIIECINMKPEQIMMNQNFTNQFAENASKSTNKISRSTNKINKSYKSNKSNKSDKINNVEFPVEFVGGSRTLFMDNHLLAENYLQSDELDSEIESVESVFQKNQRNITINQMVNKFAQLDMQGGKTSKLTNYSKHSKHSKRSKHSKHSKRSDIQSQMLASESDDNLDDDSDNDSSDSSSEEQTNKKHKSKRHSKHKSKRHSKHKSKRHSKHKLETYDQTNGMSRMARALGLGMDEYKNLNQNMQMGMPNIPMSNMPMPMSNMPMPNMPMGMPNMSMPNIPMSNMSNMGITGMSNMPIDMNQLSMSNVQTSAPLQSNFGQISMNEQISPLSNQIAQTNQMMMNQNNQMMNQNNQIGQIGGLSEEMTMQNQMIELNQSGAGEKSKSNKIKSDKIKSDKTKSYKIKSKKSKRSNKLAVDSDSFFF